MVVVGGKGGSLVAAYPLHVPGVTEVLEDDLNEEEEVKEAAQQEDFQDDEDDNEDQILVRQNSSLQNVSK